MNYKRKDVVIGLIIILLIVAGSFVYKKIKTPKPLEDGESDNISFLEEIKNDFKYDIPDDVRTIELKDVSGDDNRGIATENELLADLAAPKEGYFYQAWIEDDGNLNSLGKLVEGKGGWMLEFAEISDISGKKIIVSLENDFDSKIENRILEGSFN